MQLHRVPPDKLDEFVEAHDDIVTITETLGWFLVVTHGDRRDTAEIEVRS